MIIVVIQVLCFILVKLQINIFGITTTASGILFPIDIYLFEIIGYCYGYEYSRQAVWLNSIAHGCFFLIIEMCNFLPYSYNMKSEYIQAYHTLFQYSYWVVIGSFVGNLVGDFFSAYLVPKFKVVFKGQFTRIIILFVHILSEFITISISYSIINYPDNHSFNLIFKLVMGTMFFKIIIAILMLPLAKYLINFIKRNEGTDIYDLNQDYKIFKLSPDMNKIKFIDCIGIYNGKKSMHIK
jgi:uncharacterized PurR-regulated membrane protein YhhQ (DUF165 family)